MVQIFNIIAACNFNWSMVDTAGQAQYDPRQANIKGEKLKLLFQHHLILDIRTQFLFRKSIPTVFLKVPGAQVNHIFYSDYRYKMRL